MMLRARRPVAALAYAALAAYMVAMLVGIAGQPTVTAVECVAFAGGLLVVVSLARKSLRAWGWLE